MSTDQDIAAKAETKRCKHCGSPLSVSDRACNECGKELPSEQFPLAGLAAAAAAGAVLLLAKVAKISHQKSQPESVTPEEPNDPRERSHHAEPDVQPTSTSEIPCAIEGLYWGSLSRLTPDVFGPPGSGSWFLGTRFYVFFRCGGVFCLDDNDTSAPLPDTSDLSDAAFTRIQRDYPYHSGTYRMLGGNFVITLPAYSETRFDGRVLGPDVVKIGGTTYKRARGRPGPESKDSPSPGHVG